MQRRTVEVTVDRPLGSRHPEHPDMIYPVNYGFVKGILSGDGEEQDAYVLGVDHPVEAFAGTLIAVIHRRDDEEDKWVVAPAGAVYGKEEIRRLTWFAEQYFDTWIEMI